MSKTPKEYKDCHWTFRSGPIENVAYDKSLRNFHAGQSVNVRGYNTMVNRRKLRLASYVAAPRLVKHTQFENNPHQ